MIIYKLSVKKQKTGQKSGKKGGFPSPSDQLAEFGHILTGSKSDFAWSISDWVKIGPNRYWLSKISLNRSWLIKICSNGFWPGQNLFKLSQLVGGAGKNHLFWRVFARFLSCFFGFFTDSLNMKGIFKKNTDTKFRRSTGIPTANSTNKYQKYKSAELADQLYQGPKPYGRYRK